MITWVGFIGKLVEYLAKKIIDKTIDPTLIDERKRACKSFLDFYDSILRLEFLCEEIVEFLKSQTQNDTINLNDDWLKNTSEKIDSASYEFIAKLKELTLVIHFYDKDLSRLLSEIKRGKKGFLETASSFPQNMIFKINSSTTQDIQPSFEYTIPSDELIKIDLDEYYNSLKSKKISDIEWPNDVLLSIVSSRFFEKQINILEQEEVINLINTIQKHISFLIKAREKLNEFIRTEFAIEDLLYFTKRYFKNK